MTDRRPSTLERAFQTAQLGTASSAEDIRRSLRAEHFDNIEAHTAGTLIKRQLMQTVTAGKRARLLRFCANANERMLG